MSKSLLNMIKPSMLENKCPIGVSYGAFHTGISCMCKHMFAQGFKVSLRSASHRPCEHFFPAFIYFSQRQGLSPKVFSRLFVALGLFPTKFADPTPELEKKMF